MAVIFKKIRYKNFLSAGDGFIETTLNTHDSTIIVGHNGAGKSTLIVALFFVLFNRVYRNVKRANLVNSINRKNCVVELELTVPSGDYKIIRGLKPNIFEIYKNGELVNQSSSVKDYQEVLEKTIGLNYKSFQQVVVLSSSSYTPFMQLSTPDRREIVEDLLDIGIFSSMNEITKTRVNKLQQDISNIESTIENNTFTIDKLQRSIENSKVDYDGLINNLVKSNNSLQEQFKTEESRYQSMLQSLVSQKDVNKLKTQLQKLNGSKDKANQEISKCNHQINSNNRSVALYESGRCPTCGVNFNSLGDVITSKVEEYNNHSLQCKGIITQMTNFKSKCDEKIDKINSTLEYVNKHNSEIYYMKSSLDQIKRTIKNNENTITDLNNKKGKIVDTSVMISLTQQNKELEEKKYTLYDELRYYRALLKMVKDDGVKSRIIAQYLPFMNERINYYLEKMDAFFDFTLDENFNETIKSRFRDEFSYYSFSEGEKQRIDIALLLTWRDLAKRKNSVDTNLLIMDEIFDSSLDTSAIDMLSNILINMLAKDNNIFVISHNTEQMIDKFDRIIKVQKVNNFTEMEVL